MNRFLLLLLLLLVLKTARATTHNAANANLSTIQNLINSAPVVDGDTVLVPAGTASWTATLTVNKSITLQGATTVDTSAETATDLTIILDDTPRTGPSTGLLIFNKACRLSGFTFRKGTSSTYASGSGMIRLQVGSTVRIDNCHFDKTAQTPQIFAKNVYGVIDHNLFRHLSSSFTGGVWHSGASNLGDEAWAAPSDWGSSQFLYFEDNVVFGTSVQTSGAIDHKRGGRTVTRYNKFYDSCGPLSNHGTEGAPQRGGRAMEVYNNVFHKTRQQTPGQLRGGGALYFNNTWTGVAPGSSSIALTSFRTLANNAGFGGASGDNPWDLNDATGGPNGDGLYASGTHTGGNGSLSLVDSTKTWTSNQWQGYVVKNLDQPARGFTWNNSYPVSNTGTTITFPVNTSPDRGPALAFDAGDRYEIRKLTAALDQCGRGQGDLRHYGSGAQTWPNQVLDPIYAWNNTRPGGTITVSSAYPSILANRDYYNNTPKPGYTAYVYPHPLVSGAPAGAVMSLVGDLAFGGVTEDSCAALDFSIVNGSEPGGPSITVSSISYPAGFTGAWSGTIAPGENQSVTVTFCPTAVQSYSGTVTVNANHSSGNNTKAISGSGLLASVTEPSTWRADARILLGE